MDYSLAALKLLCSQLKDAKETTTQKSNTAFTLEGILFQRAWLQGILVSTRNADPSGRFLLDDGTGVIELLLSGDFLNLSLEVGMYIMVVGGYFVRKGGLPFIKVHKIVDLSPFPDREAMWYLEVVEAYKLFYQLPTFED
ncbi:PREDICTED: uncharacterized protein LOC109242615 isoform X2 [Nicotiana attenuata]|uniref:Uncharacterized protein n=1 Tax=Nicotiana attenuata TaxID=49451 RepID=A0A314L4K8_NICAT|nr:PREDICTED: uncharacterized protein LOC109242615 isoform X2 [Nicotiana attenuata]OIT36009.1 hypothetical protein A4A49_02943 [Nicotiana attenuata]